ATQAQLSTLETRVGRDGDLATSTQTPQHSTFGADGEVRGRIIERRHRAFQFRVVPPNFDSQRALPDGGADLVEAEIAGDVLPQAESVHARCRQNQRLAIAAFQLA